MAFNSNYTGEQIEEGIKKSLEALDLNGASVNVEIVDENTPASGTVTKEDGSNRARFDFKIPIKPYDTGWKEFNPIDPGIVTELLTPLQYRIIGDTLRFRMNPEDVEVYTPKISGEETKFLFIRPEQMGLTIEQVKDCGYIKLDTYKNEEAYLGFSPDLNAFVIWIKSSLTQITIYGFGTFILTMS